MFGLEATEIEPVLSAYCGPDRDSFFYNSRRKSYARRYDINQGSDYLEASLKLTLIERSGNEDTSLPKRLSYGFLCYREDRFLVKSPNFRAEMANGSILYFEYGVFKLISTVPEPLVVVEGNVVGLRPSTNLHTDVYPKAKLFVLEEQPDLAGLIAGEETTVGYMDSETPFTEFRVHPVQGIIKSLWDDSRSFKPLATIEKFNTELLISIQQGVTLY